MRTIVTTKNQTTYVVTDRDIIEALVGLGIPRSVLFSEDTTIKMDKKTRGEKGFYFTDDENIDAFLTVEGPVEVTAAESAKEEVYPNGTVLVGQYKGAEYTILGYDGSSNTYTIREEVTRRTFQSPRGDTHNKCIYRVKPPEPTPEPVKEEVYPNGTVLTGQSTGATYVVIDYYYQTREYNIESLKDYRRYTEPRYFVHNPDFYKVVQPYPEGTVLIGQASGNRYTVVKYNDLTKGYTLRNGDITTFESFRCVHNPALFTVAPTPEPAPAPARLPVGSVVTFKRHNGTEELCYIVGYRNDCAGYVMWNVTNKCEVWDHHSEVVKVGGSYTVVYTPDPNRNTKPFDGAYPLGTVFKHNRSGFTLIVTRYSTILSKGYDCYTDKYKAGQEVHHYLTNPDIYTVLYTPSEQPKT